MEATCSATKGKYHCIPMQFATELIAPPIRAFVYNQNTIYQFINYWLIDRLF